MPRTKEVPSPATGISEPKSANGDRPSPTAWTGLWPDRSATGRARWPIGGGLPSKLRELDRDGVRAVANQRTIVIVVVFRILKRALDPSNLVDPLGLYEGCTHGAMAEFIGNLSGNLTSKQAKDLGNYASDLPGGADSFKYAATNPLNFLKAFIYEGGPSANIHFATELQIFVGKTIFQSLIGSGEDFSVQQAGFIIHSIQDMHGPHGDFGLRRGFGHTMGGTAVDKVLGDTKFDNVSNELLRLFSNDQSRSLSQVDKFKLLRAINNRCNPPKPIPVASSGNVGGINPHPFIGIPNISYGSNVSPWRFPIPPTPIGVGSYPNFITVPG